MFFFVQFPLLRFSCMYKSIKCDSPQQQQRNGSLGSVNVDARISKMLTSKFFCFSIFIWIFLAGALDVVAHMIASMFILSRNWHLQKYHIYYFLILIPKLIIFVSLLFRRPKIYKFAVVLGVRRYMGDRR